MTGSTQVQNQSTSVQPKDSQSPIQQRIGLGSKSENSPIAAPSPDKQTSTAKAQSSQTVPASSSVPSSPKSMRTIRKPNRVGLSSRLQNVDLDAGPLGPLGANKEDGAMITKMTLEPSPPRPPSKDAAPSVPSSPPMHTYMRASSMDGHRQVSVHEEDLSRAASIPVQVRAPSMPLEQAANPTFYITVGDPHRIGDITSAHTVYKVSTKTTSRAFKTPEFSVSRRYRDFLWLYEQLCKSSPGAIVPPPPEKQAMNRFAENFVESRRFALERMLEKIAKHPILSRDGDFKLFLESESFTTDSKYRERETRSSGESKGFMASVGGAFGASLPFSGKYVEQDEFFDDRKAAFDLLEQQLKSLLRAVDMVVRQRKDLASSTADFGAALSVLSTVELSKSLSNALGSLSDLQLKIKELHERQAQQDLLTLGHTVDEYLRLVASVKGTFETRRKAWTSWQTAESDMQKRKAYADKVRRQTKTQQDRMSQIEAELGEAERKSHALRLEFDNIGKLLKAELLRFDMDKVEDFKTSVEMFLESAVESQKEVIELWETYSETIAAKELQEEDGYTTEVVLDRQTKSTEDRGLEETGDGRSRDSDDDSNGPKERQDLLAAGLLGED